MQRVSRRTNQSNDSNQQRVYFARQKTINHFEIVVDVVFLVISNNQFHLISLRHVVVVFIDDENVMLIFNVEVSFTHAQKFEIARVLFS